MSDIDNLLAAVDAVIALHDRATSPDPDFPSGPSGSVEWCFECGAQKPCPTLRLLSFFRGFTGERKP